MSIWVDRVYENAYIFGNLMATLNYSGLISGTRYSLRHV